MRAARYEDAAAWAEIYNQGIEERQATFETEPRTGADLMPNIERTIVAERDGRIVGWANITPPAAKSSAPQRFSSPPPPNAPSGFDSAPGSFHSPTTTPYGSPTG